MASKSYQRALVTGASKGIGAAICRTLAREGLEVRALARDRQALLALAKECDGIIPLVADVTDMGAMATALAGAEIDVLVNNAGGLGTVRPLHEQSLDETSQTIMLNCLAPMQLIQLLLPGMIARGCGHIFNVTSVAAHSVSPGTTAYGAAKAALSHAGRILRYDLAGTNVRISEIIPGRVETGFYLQAFDGNQTALTERMYAAHRALQPNDVAATLVSALRMPSHVNLAQIEVSPTDQAAGGHVFGTLRKAGSEDA